MRAHSARAWGATLLLASVALLSGCAGSPATAPLPDGGPGTAPLATSISPAMPSVQDQVRAAYLAYWGAVIHAHRLANARDPLLAARAGDPQLTRVRQIIERNRVQELSVRGTVSHQLADVSVNGTVAKISDCYDVSRWNPVSLKTGKPVSVTQESGTGRYRGRFSLARQASGWVVVDSVILGGC